MIDTQIQLENEMVVMIPLKVDDFEDLYQVASDPKIWEQHPNKDRWQREVFQVFFEGAIQSKGAYKIIDKKSGTIIGSTRMYDFDPIKNIILIGYTFFAVDYWGKGHNHASKRLLIDYVFQYVDEIHFHIGAQNLRSQISIERLGAEKIDEILVAYYGEPSKHNFVYRILKQSR